MPTAGFNVEASVVNGAHGRSIVSDTSMDHTPGIVLHVGTTDALTYFEVFPPRHDMTAVHRLHTATLSRLLDGIGPYWDWNWFSILPAEHH